jgi:hypothetical protein
VRRGIAVGLVVATVAGCGSGAIRGALDWKSGPQVTAQSASGVVQNTTGHSFTLDPKAMRLLDKDGRKVAARFGVGAAELPAHASARLDVRWKSGKPVRIDYGAGTLSLNSG